MNAETLLNDTGERPGQVLRQPAAKRDAKLRDIFLVCNSATEMGGLNVWAHQFARLMSERGHRVHIIGITPPNVPHDYGADLPYRVSTLYGEHPRAGMGRRSPRTLVNPASIGRELRRRAETRRAAERLSAMLTGAAPGGVVVVAQVWAMEWVVLADTHGMPVIGMSHESFAAANASSRGSRMLRRYAQVDQVVLLTQQDTDAWIRAGLYQATTLPNPAPLSPERPSPRTARTVVAVGRLSHEKGYDMLLESWQRVAPRHPDWNLTIYGAGPEATELHRFADELGISDTVRFPGRTNNVEAALYDAAIFAMPSRAEGFPLSALEAMAMALPTVAFDCAPGVREILTDETDSLVVPPGDTNRFATALNRLIDDQALRDRMGEAALARVARFSPEAIIRRWERLFELVYR
jgi:glycosyltransferase involved in cell wall biosynthesis